MTNCDMWTAGASVKGQVTVHETAPKVLYTPWAIKNGATFIFTITLANVNRFQ